MGAVQSKLVLLPNFSVTNSRPIPIQLKYNKKYPNEQEEQRRIQIFRENKKRVEKQNQLFLRGKVSFKSAINQFGDMLTSEVNARVNGLKMGPYRLVIEKFSTQMQIINGNSSFYIIPGSTLQITLLNLSETKIKNFHQWSTGGKRAP